jgi:hypothetical protein
MRTYVAVSGHTMRVVSTRTDSTGHEVPVFWNAAHADSCPCLTSNDW